jgi:hypothetical protein
VLIIFYSSFLCMPGSRKALQNMIRTLKTTLTQRK